MADSRRGPVEAAPSPSLGARLLAQLVPYGLVLAVAGLSAFALWLALGSARFEWGRPWGFALLFVVPLLALFSFHWHGFQSGTIAFSRTADLRASSGLFARQLAHLPRAIRLVAVALVCVAIARPQRPGADVTEVEGIDIVVALDVSNSMSERDLAPNRLAAAKAVLQKFIRPRQSDRIGLVIFGREAFTQCPLTLDHKSLSALLDDVRLDLIDGRGTAIGNAIGTALNRLRRSDAKSKVIILLTDGDNNAGNLSPEQAARYAQSLGVKVFTVLMGRDADPQPAGRDLFGNLVHPPPRYPVNPKLLEEIAGLTGGTPYLATDAPALERRFQSILDELDKSRIKDQKGRPQPLHLPFLAVALILILAELVLSMTRFRRFP